MIKRTASAAILLILFVFGCSEPPSTPLDYHRLSASALPTESYKREPAVTPDDASISSRTSCRCLKSLRLVTEQGR